MRTNLFCHDCNGYFDVDFDESLNGNHVVNCPHCGHEHCRVIKDGIVTNDRWDSRNGQTYYSVAYNYTTTYAGGYSGGTDFALSWGSSATSTSNAC